MRVIKLIHDVDFHTLSRKRPPKVSEEEIAISFRAAHGDVMYAAGLVEDDEDALMCLGSEDGKQWGVAVYKPFLDFQTGWYDLIGKPHLKTVVPADIGRVEYT